MAGTVTAERDIEGEDKSLSRVFIYTASGNSSALPGCEPKRKHTHRGQRDPNWAIRGQGRAFDVILSITLESRADQAP